MTKPKLPQSILDRLTPEAQAAARDGDSSRRMITREMQSLQEFQAAKLRLLRTDQELAVLEGEIADLNAARKTIKLQQETIEHLKTELVEKDRRHLAEKAESAMAVHSRGSQR